MKTLSPAESSPAYGESSCIDRALQVHEWNYETACGQAQAEGIELSLEHLAVFYFLRTFYVAHGWPVHRYRLTRLLEQEFAAQGGAIYLHQLFPGGVLTQGIRLAGLPGLGMSTGERLGSRH